MSNQAEPRDQPLSWRASPHYRRALTIGFLALLGGLAAGRPALVALAAVPLAFVAVGGRRRPPATGALTVSALGHVAFEEEPVPLLVSVRVEHPIDVIAAAVTPGTEVAVAPASGARCASATLRVAAELRATHWGERRLGRVDVVLTDDAGRYRAHLARDLRELAALPRPAPMAQPALRAVRGGLSGDHRGRRTGVGIEFAHLRPYVPGDSPNHINWPVTLRLQRPHINQRLTEDAVDVVLAVDSCSDVGPAGASSLDLSVRGAVALANALLQAHDRVGLLALGGGIRWVRPATGRTQLFRIGAALTDLIATDSFLDPDVRRVPPIAVPSGAHVILFSPLLDERVLPAIEHLRLRGVEVSVIDVLTAHPAPHGRTAELAYRTWLLGREATAHQLGTLGVLVLPWDGEFPLDVVLRPALSRRGLVRAR